MTAVGQELRPHLFKLFFLQGRRGRWGSAGGGYAEQGLPGVGEYDDPILVPRAAIAGIVAGCARHVADFLNRASADRDAFELTLGEERNVLAVRRPERIARAF